MARILQDVPGRPSPGAGQAGRQMGASLFGEMKVFVGFGPEDIGWLALCGERGLGVTDRDRIEVRGENPDSVRRHFLPHTNFPIQRRWRDAWAD